MDDREGSGSHLYITSGPEISAPTQNCCRQKKSLLKRKNFQSQLYSPSFTHPVFHLLLTLPLLLVSAIHLHAHSSHASAFLLLSSSIPPFLHLLLCLLRPFLSSSMQHLSGREQDPAWVVSRRIKNG